MNRPRFLFSLGLLSLLTIALSAYMLLGRADSSLRGTVVESPPDISSVILTDAEGGPFSFEQLKGNVTLVFFGYSKCPDVCPLTMGRLAKIYLDLGEPADLEVVMVTVDPEHDSPETVQTYVNGFHPDFIGLGGSPEAIANAARRFYIGFVSTGEKAVSHTDAVILLDREATMRLVYGQDKLRWLEADLRTLLKL